MEGIQYIGEHLLPGQIGQAAIVLGFVGALLSAIGYFMATNRVNTPEYQGWKNIGRAGYGLHILAIMTIVGTLFYIMNNAYMEYSYVQQHVSRDLPKKYILSAFWEGQEGSFILWMFWHAVLGGILMWKGRKWETSVLASLALVQVVLVSMIMGVYIGDMKFGSNPFLLLRDTMDIPLFNNADYVSLVKGNGLNPLLQNYWNTIHPPTTFLGFASTVVPFCYAVAGLWTGKYKEWLNAVYPWALFSGAILGTGILMGGAWAYEALSFGGYWAWDPVENMSLVPWLLIIAGIHTNMIARNTNHSIKATFLFYILGFVLITYSTFLTRSGVLGDTSVHAFTEMGLENQLVGMVSLFFFLGIIPLAINWKKIPAPQKEEATPSREFWMFIGSLVLLFSAAMITATTSLPIYNKIVEIFDPEFAGWTINDPVAHYNKYQLWIGVLIGGLSGFTQFLRYRAVNWEGRKKQFWIQTAVAMGISAALTYLATLWINANAWQYMLLLFTGIYAVISNIQYLTVATRQRTKMVAGALAHIGFGLMIVGVMASGLNKEHISTNIVAQRGLLEEEMLDKNVLLFKNIPMFMSGYEVTYTRDTMVGNERFFEINYKKLDEVGKVTEEFTVLPTATYNNQVTKVAAMNPDTKHYLFKDVFTHIATLPRREYDFEFAQEQEDSMDYTVYQFEIGDTILVQDTLYAKGTPIPVETKVVLESINPRGTHPDYEPVEGDLAVSARLAFIKEDPDTTFYAEPLLVLRQNLLYPFSIQMNDISLKVRLTEEIFDYVFTPESELDYDIFTMEQGQEINLNGNKIVFQGFEKEVQHPDYEPLEGDIALTAKFLVNDKHQAAPIYLIRDSRQLNIKDVITDIGMHFRFNGIDTEKGSVEVMIAENQPKSGAIPIEIAKNSLRTDYVILETIVFPGINFFWIGASLMMVALAIGMVVRIRERRRREGDVRREA